MTRGDSRIAVTIAKNEYTKLFGRENRFLIDDPESPQPLAYTLSKPFKLTGLYNNQGIYKFVLQEVVTTEFDNFELGIADYYKHFPKPDGPIDVEDSDVVINPDENIDSETGKKVWL